MNMISGQPDESRPAAKVVGFWRRSFAFWLDSLILALIGWMLIMLVGDALMRLGHWARLIGFVIASLYFTLLEGGPGRGQSLGKRLMKIKVVRFAPTGLGPLPYSQAGLRYAIVGVPTVVGGLAFIGSNTSNSPALWWLVALNGVLVGIWLFALGYLYLFNRPTRRTLQDLATSTIVVPVSETNGLLTPVRPVHWKILTGAAIVIGIGAAVGVHFMTPTYRELGDVQRVVSTVPGVGEVGVWSGTSSINSSQGRTTSHGVAISFTLSNADMRCEQITPQVAKAALQGWPAASHRDYMSVICMRSIELGIVHWRNQTVTTHSPKQWSAQLDLPM